MKKLVKTLVFAVTLSLGIWTLAVTFTPIASNFSTGDEVSASAFNDLFTAINDNFVLAEDAINNHDHFGQTWNGSGLGLRVESTGSGGTRAIEGIRIGGTPNPVGVYGEASSSSGRGVFGNATSTTGSTAGVRGEVDSTASGATGVFGIAINSSATGTGVKGQANGTAGYGVWGTGGGGAHGVLGQASNASRYGVWAINSATGGVALRAEGNVQVTGSVSKGSGTFMIDHPLDPLNKLLFHSFVESPDMMNIYNGNITTDTEGYATVVLPAYFEALNHEFRYQLTAIGDFAQVIVANEIEQNSFVIRSDKPNLKVSWQVTGVRQDPFALANPVEVEVLKAEADRGTYIHSEAYGMLQGASPQAIIDTGY